MNGPGIIFATLSGGGGIMMGVLALLIVLFLTGRWLTQKR